MVRVGSDPVLISSPLIISILAIFKTLRQYHSISKIISLFGTLVEHGDSNAGAVYTVVGKRDILGQSRPTDPNMTGNTEPVAA